MIPFLLINLVKIAFVIWVMLTIVAYTVGSAERKVCVRGCRTVLGQIVSGRWV